MTIMMPEADQATLDRREEIVAALSKIVPGEGVISSNVKCSLTNPTRSQPIASRQWSLSFLIRPSRSQRF